MLRFYARLINRAFRVFFESTDRWQNILGLALYLLGLLTIINQQLVKLVTDTWQGIPYWIGFIVLATLFTYGFLKANYDEFCRFEEQVAGLQDRLEPQLELVFDVDRFPSSRMEWIDPIRPGNVTVRLYRVAVRNVSMATIDDVKVSVEDFHPQGARFLPIELRFMHDHSEDGQLSRQGFTLNPDEVRFADVASKQLTTHPHSEIQLRYAVPNVPNTIPPRRYTLRLRATGRNVPSYPTQFIMDVDENGGLIFEADTRSL